MENGSNAEQALELGSDWSHFVSLYISYSYSLFLIQTAVYVHMTMPATPTQGGIQSFTGSQFMF